MSTNQSANDYQLPGSVLSSTAGTVTAWVNTSLAQISSTAFAAVSATDAGSDQFLFGYWNGIESFGSYGATDYRIRFSSASYYNLGTNAWHQMAYTWNTSSGVQAAYLDGQPMTAVATIPTTVVSFSPAYVYLATNITNPSYSWPGIMDEVKFSNLALPASWIATEYANQVNSVSASKTFYNMSSENPN